MSVKATMTIEKGAKDKVIKKFEEAGFEVEVVSFREGKNVDYLTLLLKKGEGNG